MSTVNPREVIARSLGHMVDLGRTYGRALPDDLARWHCYTLDGGHSILVVLDDGTLGDAPSRSKIEDQLVPAPVKAVERAGWRMLDGFVVCKLPYDPELGLVTDPEDDEYGDGGGQDEPAAAAPLYALAVGQPYPHPVRWTDGQAETRILAGGVDFVLPLSRPSDSEVHAFGKGNAEFALYPEDHFLLLLYRFTNPKNSRNPAAAGPGIAWSDAAWEYQRQARVAPPMPPGSEGGTFPMQLVMVDADTNTVRALRLLTPPVGFADAVRAAVARQAAHPVAFERGLAEINALYARYPDSADLLPLCEARFEALRDGKTR